MAKIVLAHGFLGFGTFGNDKVSYFNGVQAAYEKAGHEVLAERVAALGSIEQRAGQLVGHIQKRWGTTTDDIFMIGHSMGGLDCRRIIATHAEIGPRVARLITICTPHFGSPVATAVHTATGPLWDAIPWLLRAGINGMFKDDQGALKDLCVRPALQDSDVEGVEYLRVGADPGFTFLPSWLFSLSQGILAITKERNDGVVTLSSASAGGPLLGKPWKVDHGGAIGWPTNALGVPAVRKPPADHVARYVGLLGPLLQPRIKKP